MFISILMHILLGSGMAKNIRKLEGKIADFHAGDDILGQIAKISLADGIKKAN